MFEKQKKNSKKNYILEQGWKNMLKNRRIEM